MKINDIIFFILPLDNNSMSLNPALFFSMKNNGKDALEIAN